MQRNAEVPLKESFDGLVDGGAFFGASPRNWSAGRRAMSERATFRRAMRLKKTGEEETAVAPLGGGPKDPRVRKVIALMQEHYDRDLTLGKLASSVHLSVWHLCHLFKTETGRPPAQFLKSIRMEEARRLLESTLLSVKEVLNKVGMSDQSHFVKDFKKIYGRTPTNYRSALAGASHSKNSRDESAKEFNSLEQRREFIETGSTE